MNNTDQTDASSPGTETWRAALAAIAAAGMLGINWMAATGRLGGVDTAAVSDKYSTLVTPAGYAFSIWSLIYLGVIAFTIYQVLPRNIARFRPVRSAFIFSCALNAAWLYFWHAEQIVICFAIIFVLAAVLVALCYQFRKPDSVLEAAVTKAPFGIYAGWVTAATLVNFAIMLRYLRVDLGPTGELFVAVILLMVAASLAVLARLVLRNALYPLAVAWALTAIAVEQSGRTAIVVAAAIGVITGLIASASIVLGLKTSRVAS